MRFRAIARLARLGPVTDSKVGLLVVGRPVGQVRSQVRSFVIAELITGAVLIIAASVDAISRRRSRSR